MSDPIGRTNCHMKPPETGLASGLSEIARKLYSLPQKETMESPIDSIMWVVHPSFVLDKDGNKWLEYGKPVIKLEWGWTAGMSPEDLAELAEDAPTGSDYVFLTLNDAKALKFKLSSMIAEYEHAEKEKNEFPCLAIESGMQYRCMVKDLDCHLSCHLPGAEQRAKEYKEKHKL